MTKSLSNIRFTLDPDFIRLSTGYDYNRVNVLIEHNLNTDNPWVTEFTVVEN